MYKIGLYFFEIKGRYFVYDINTTACAAISPVALTILPDLIKNSHDNLSQKYHNIYSEKQISLCLSQCQELLDTGKFGSGSPAYRHHIQKDLISIVLHVAHACNMQCKYCYADNGEFGNKPGLMSEEVMHKALTFAFEQGKRSDFLEVGFFGGEPLLNFRLIHKAVAHVRSQARLTGKMVNFSLTSNATLLNDEIMNFLAEERFSLIFSLDGPAKIHDRMRLDKKGRPTHQLILQNILTFKENYSNRFMVRGTFTATTPNFAEQVLSLNELGFDSISVEPAQLEDTHPHCISPDGKILRILHEYETLADMYVEQLIKGRPLRFFHFDDALRRIIFPEPYHKQCGAGGGLVAVAPDGRLFPCFEAVVEDENCIGHVDTGFDRHKRLRFQKIHADTKKVCRDCWIKYSCGGGCHAFNIRYNNNINVPYEPNCLLIKHRYKLAAWILAKVVEQGDEALEKLKSHVSIKPADPACHPEHSQ
jgi:uncharacterized protein